ncbi:MAG TPA: GNAT family N-acetyltransferase [Gemmatimonadaceae bacterium]|nr:GNAT family N-acetyltransferase [Gemmatimonadaceae bacterium]
MPLGTAHLTLLECAPQHLLAMIDSPEQFEDIVGMPIADGLREFYTSGEVSQAWLDALRSSTETDPWRHGFFIVDRDSNQVVGTAGFKGPPDNNGVVEIAYGVAPDYQGRGYATEAARALVEFALANSAVTIVRAHTLPEANASTRVLSKNGFRHLGEVIDPEDGRVWRWELPRT